MPSVEEGALTRSIKGLLIGTVKRANEARLQRELEGLSETEEQFQIDISGKSATAMGWTEVHLAFATTFVDATGQRDSWLVRPQFTYGCYISRGGPLGITACVTRWDENQRREITGCMLSVGVMPTEQAGKFRGELHATFQGYGAPTEVYGDLSQYDEE